MEIRLTKEETIKALECCYRAENTELCDRNCPLIDVIDVTENVAECNKIIMSSALRYLKQDSKLQDNKPVEFSWSDASKKFVAVEIKSKVEFIKLITDCYLQGYTWEYGRLYCLNPYSSFDCWDEIYICFIGSKHKRIAVRDYKYCSINHYQITTYPFNDKSVDEYSNQLLKISDMILANFDNISIDTDYENDTKILQEARYFIDLAIELRNKIEEES